MPRQLFFSDFAKKILRGAKNYDILAKENTKKGCITNE